MTPEKGVPVALSLCGQDSALVRTLIRFDLALPAIVRIVFWNTLDDTIVSSVLNNFIKQIFMMPKVFDRSIQSSIFMHLQSSNYGGTKIFNQLLDAMRFGECDRESR